MNSCCNLVNVKWSLNDEENEDFVDSIEAVILGPRGVYASLIGTLVIVIHDGQANLLTINQAHVTLRAFAGMPMMICYCLYQDLKGREACSSPVVCAPAVAHNMDNDSWTPVPKMENTAGSPRAKLPGTAILRSYDAPGARGLDRLQCPNNPHLDARHVRTCLVDIRIK